MNNIVLVLQIVLSILVIGMILVQAKGKGLSSSFGGSGSSFTRRGLEKWLFKATFVVATAFIIVSIFEII